MSGRVSPKQSRRWRRALGAVQACSALVALELHLLERLMPAWIGGMADLSERGLGIAGGLAAAIAIRHWLARAEDAVR